MHLDYKYTKWGRIYFKEDADKNKIIKALNEGHLPFELCDEEFKFDYFNSIDNTEEFISSNENDGQSTIELYEENEECFPKCVWDNSYESEIERKNENKA